MNNLNKKALFALAVFTIAVVSVFVYGNIILKQVPQYPFSQSQSSPNPASSSSPTPTLKPNPTPTPIASVVLSPNNQIVNLSLNQQTDFNVTIAQKGYYNLQFPCTITIISNIGSSTELGLYSSYGTYAFNFDWSGFMPIFTQLPSQGELISFYSLVKDSDGSSITSNTVTVEYK